MVPCGQGIISYLESKLQRLQHSGKQPSLDAGAVDSAGAECLKLAAAEAPAAAGSDEAGMVSDGSSRSSLTVGDWAAAAAELESQVRLGTAAAAAGGGGGSRGSTWGIVRSGSGAEGSPEGRADGEGLGQALAAAAPTRQHFSGKAQAGAERVQVAAWAVSTQEQPTTTDTVAAAAARGEDAGDTVGDDTGAVVYLATPLRRAPAAAGAAVPAAALADEVTPLRRSLGQGADVRWGGHGCVLDCTRAVLDLCPHGFRCPPPWRQLLCLLVSFTPPRFLPPGAASGRLAQGCARPCAHAAAE